MGPANAATDLLAVQTQQQAHPLSVMTETLTISLPKILHVLLFLKQKGQNQKHPWIPIHPLLIGEEQRNQISIHFVTQIMQRKKPRHLVFQA